ncbi:T9SS type B sorting domain-containing protein [Flavobacterium sp. Sd200]|uniref:T9SS type B sorting domain-containing protein n=1 Tax=Flavobacterium sp. Sd200 TaxID=2692211 RepID=UPI00136F0C7D|nr:T9SS type B sorting domain-containing protein [Flavobacterium sp. Sd200]MXN91537.1 T9SS type B sorting domain-containing protein [Flavobacterium sp. Sd200]
MVAQSDCPDAIIVCGNNNFSNLNATGVGNIQEINWSNACHSEEHNTLWLKILIKNGGTLGFILTPEEIDDLVVDFDFWIYGPNVNCSNKGTAIRCSTTNPLAAGLTYNTTGMNDVETDVAEGPNEDGNAFIKWMDVNDDDTYYIVIDRPHGASNFSIEWTGTATFHEVPVFYNPDNIPLDMVQCDDDGVDDQSDTFDLTIYETMFIGNQTDVAITYHRDINDMTTGERPLANPAAYKNITNPQRVYLRMTNPVTGCFDTNWFDIAIDTTLVTGTANNFVLCDMGNGVREFNLAQNDSLVNMGDTNTTVVYYKSESDARNKQNPLPALYQNSVPYAAETIWARMENITGCFGYGLTSFTVSIDTFIPIGLPENMTLCDLDENGYRLFDLSYNNTIATQGDPDMTVSYYRSENAARNSHDAITEPYRNIIPYGPQTMWARVEYTNGCYGYNIMPFTVTVEPLPEIVYDIVVKDFTPGSNSITIQMDSDFAKGYEFSLNGADYSDNMFYSRLKPGIYTVYIRSKDKCKVVSREVAILNYPKFFTPNHDGTNELWNVYYLNFFKDAVVYIFDLYGKLIKSYRGDEAGWDGTFHGRNLPATDYWFKLEFPTGRIIRGHFSLLR